MQRIAFRLILSSCVCVCVCVSFRVCVWRVCRRQENGLRWRRRFYFRLREMTPDITCKSFTQIRLQISRGRTVWRPWNTTIGYYSAIYLYRYFVFHWIVRNDTGHQLWKFDTSRITNSKIADKMAAVQGMAVSQAFIFHFKCYNVLHFAVFLLVG